MLRLCRWIADYYLCEWGQAIEAVVPAAVREKAGTREVTLLERADRRGRADHATQTAEETAHALKILAASSRPLTPQELSARRMHQTRRSRDCGRRGW